MDEGINVPVSTRSIPTVFPAYPMKSLQDLPLSAVSAEAYTNRPQKLTAYSDRSQRSVIFVL